MKKPGPSKFNFLRSIALTFSSLLFFCSISFSQTVRYVATTGLDANPGTLANPCKTIAEGIAVAIAGDTIKVAAGTYLAPATTLVNKSVAIIGTGANSSSVILTRGSYATSAIIGFSITANNVTIKRMRITNYNVGIANTGIVSNLTLDSVQLFENWGSGFSSTLGIDSLAITNSYIAYNGKSPSTAAATLKRGIYLSTGITYGKIRFDKDTVDYNGLGGIEISSINTTTSIDGITITNNLIRNNDDGAQVSVWLGTANQTKKAVLISGNTIVLSDTARYGIELRNPAGTGQTSGTGSVVVSNNIISVVSHTGNSTDMAAIAVERRKEGSALVTMNNQPMGIVISGNTISDFQNPKAGEAYGIVLGGIGHKVFGNTISNTEFPIQLQKGNVNFGSNASATFAAGQANNLYFDRDNSMDACAEIGANTITTSGSPRLTTAVGTTSLTLRSNTVTNTRSNETFCTIQQGIDFLATVTGDTLSANPGTYNEAVTVTKSVAIIGTGTTSADVILTAPVAPYSTTAGTGFLVSVSNVYLKKIKVTNFVAGVSTTIAVSNLTMDSVSLTENFGAGFYSIFSLDSLAITNSILSYNGNKTGFTSTSLLKRGIYLSTGPVYNKIRFDNNTVDSNGTAGIEISSINTTTSIDGVTITNNRVRNNADAQISTWLGTANPLKKAILISNNTIIVSDTARYGIELRNPAGNGTISGDGSVVVSNNNISVVAHTGNGRDMAAIAVIRRKEGSVLAAMNDQPQGVIVSGNTISDFRNLGAADAYGIVFGGTGHKVFGNIISNTQFPLQLQKGNTNYLLSTSTPNLFGQANDAYFDRDNSKDACVEIGSNTITTSGAPRLTTGSATTSLTLPAKTTTNTTIAQTFCSLQQAIDFKATVAGNTITANAGTYDEQVTISKALIIDGVDSSNRLATFTGIPVAPWGVFNVTAPNVTIKNFKFIVDQSKLYSAIITSGVTTANLLITGNNIVSDNPYGDTLVRPYGSRNAIWVNNSSNLIVQSNTINALKEKFRGGVAAGTVNGVHIGGSDSSLGNNFIATINHDVILTNYLGNDTVQNNIFKGGGIEVSASNSNGAMVITNNIFDGTYCHTIPSAMARLFTNTWVSRTINFSYNQFINQKWSISFENTRNVVLDHNDITAVYDSFRLISVNTKLRQTGRPATLETIDIKLTNNNLSATAGLTTGNGIEFLNFDQRSPANNYVAGNYIIGELGNENNFNANIPTFVMVSNLDSLSTINPDSVFLKLYPEYQGVQYPSTTGYWTRDIFARHNRYFVNGSLKLASTFGEADFNSVYKSIFDRQDDIHVGSVVLMPTWSGAVSTDWSDANNWSYKFVPTAGLDAVIFPEVNKPVLTADASCDTIILSSAMKVITGTHKLTVFGNIRSTGLIDATLGNIVLGGSKNQLLSGSMIVKNLTLNNSAGATIQEGDTNEVTLLGRYVPTQGVLVTNGNLTLKSDSVGTAGVDIGSSSGGYISGDVTVERYLSAHKGWRFLSVPTGSTQTVRQTWQEGGTGNNDDPIPGRGIQVTGAGGLAAGFDLYTALPSMKTYNSLTNTWIGILNTTSAIIKNTTGYMVLVRGDRTANAFLSPPSKTVLRTKGNLYTGDLSPISFIPNKFGSVGNPYAAELDMRLINKTGLKDFFYLWDPLLGGNFGLGAYQTFTNDGAGNYEVTPGLGSYGSVDSPSNYIESGQAFFVQATATGGTVTFTEDAKSEGSGPVSRIATATQSKLRTSLYGVNADSSTYMIDGVLNNFNDSYSNTVDDLDAIKLTNVAENLSIKRANILLVVERRYSIVKSDTIFLNLSGEKVQKYRFEVKADQFNEQGVTGFFEDNYLHTKTALNLYGTTAIDFNIVNIPGSYAADRFRIVLTPSQVLPVTFTSVKAYQENKDIAVEWKAENENNLKEYTVEKSLNGNHFTAGTTIAAKNAIASTYNWLDVNPSQGYNYYRISSIDINGKRAYSTVVKVFTGKGAQNISVFPNPVSGGTISIQFTNQPAGEYGILLLNQLGQVMISKQITHTEGSSSEIIQIDKNSARGIYKMEVSKPGGGKTNINVSVLR